MRLEADGVRVERGDVPVLRGVSLAVDAARIAQVHGPNGSGKTTLLRTLCGLVRPDSGAVRWRGEDIGIAASRYRGELAYLGHDNAVKLDLTAPENLAAARALCARPSQLDPDAVLARVGLDGSASRRARLLSAGQRRRLALARLIAVHATVWILDEPFTSLDDAGQRMVEKLLAEHVARGGLVVLAGHRPRDIPGLSGPLLPLAGPGEDP